MSTCTHKHIYIYICLYEKEQKEKAATLSQAIPQIEQLWKSLRVWACFYTFFFLFVLRGKWAKCFSIIIACFSVVVVVVVLSASSTYHFLLHRIFFFLFSFLLRPWTSSRTRRRCSDRQIKSKQSNSISHTKVLPSSSPSPPPPPTPTPLFLFAVSFCPFSIFIFFF